MKKIHTPANGMVILALFFVACIPTGIKPLGTDQLSGPKSEELKIQMLDKTSGESIKFSSQNPGKVRNNSIAGIGTITVAVETIEIQSSDIQSVSRKNGSSLSIKTRDGKTFDLVKNIVERGDRSILFVMKPVLSKQWFFIIVAKSEVEKAWAVVKSYKIWPFIIILFLQILL